MQSPNGIIAEHFIPSDIQMTVSETVFSELERLTGTDQVRKDPDIDLFGHKLLDSLGAVELTISLGEQFGLELSPSDIDRELWATPRKIIDYFISRTAAG
jgi:D-alanine--poly(phosphoribitol) ligase subunit 2